MVNERDFSIGIILKFSSLEQLFYQKKFFIETLCKNFKKFYFINTLNLESTKNNFKYNSKNFKKILPKNSVLIDPITKKDFDNFCSNKKLVLFANLGYEWKDIGIHFLLKKNKCRLIFAANVGNQQGSEIHSVSSFLTQFFFKFIPRKIVLLLSFMGLVPKIDLRFVSNFKTYKALLYSQNRIFYKTFSLFYNKKIYLVNSMAFDEFKTSKRKPLSKNIVMVDTNINHNDQVRFSGRISNHDVIKIYKELNIFLKQVSKVYDKKIIVCVHPSSDLKFVKKMMREFKVVKYQTKKHIFNAFIVFFYESASIVDAFASNKRIVTLQNDLMGQGWINQIQRYPKISGIQKINITNGYNINNKMDFLKKLDISRNSRKFKNFVKLNVKGDGDQVGTFKIIKILKSEYRFN